MLTRVIILFIASCFLPQQLFAEETISLRTAINKAARQQTLTQQIAKIYLILTNKTNSPQVYTEQKEAIDLFQKQLDELEAYTPTVNIKANLKMVRILWEDYKTIANWNVNKKSAKQLFKVSDEMHFAAEQLLDSYKNYAKKLNDNYYNNNMMDFIQLISETGEQRMLTQRIMLLYLALKQHIEPLSTQHKLQVSVDRYHDILTHLENTPYNSFDINNKLRNMREDWNRLITLLNAFQNPSPNAIKQMLQLTQQLSQTADKVSVLYEDLGTKLSISKSINVASYQNMLTQRIAKSYVAITYDYSPAKHKRELLTCIDLFEDKMKSIKRSARTKEIQDAVNVVQTMWKNYKTLVTNWENMDELTVTKVLESGHVIMATCDRVAQEIENHAQTISDYKSFFIKENGEAVAKKDNIAHQIYLAGLQRMYSQRIAIYFLMNSLEIDTRLSKRRLDDCLQICKKNFQTMLEARVNTPEITQYLSQLQQEWKALEMYCTQLNKDDITTVLQHSLSTFDKLDMLNMLYEKHMDNLLTEKSK